MKRRGHARGFVFGAVATAVAAAAQLSPGGALLPLDAYMPIVARRPFGELAKPAPKAAPQIQPEEAQLEQQREAVARQVDLVAVNVTLRGSVAVGFIDKSVKPPRSLYLGIGESEAGYTVESADFAAETATISKDGVSVTLKLGSGIVGDGAASSASASASPAAAPAAAATSSSAPAAQPAVPRVIRRPFAAGRPGGYRAMVAERRQSEEAAVAAEENRRRDEAAAIAREAADASAAKREHDMNFKLLLEGKDPVSEIQLTPEEERELESKGILSPAAAE